MGQLISHTMESIDLTKITEETPKSKILLIRGWMNNNTTRKNSFTKKMISEKDHLNYWNSFFMVPGQRAYFVTVGDKEVGVIRVNAIKEVSIVIDPDYRLRGIGGQALIKLTLVEPPPLSAKIIPSNLGSMKIFEKAGFKSEYIYLKFSGEI